LLKESQRNENGDRNSLHDFDCVPNGTDFTTPLPSAIVML
jgi:hypothetical protein